MENVLRDEESHPSTSSADGGARGAQPSAQEFSYQFPVANPIPFVGRTDDFAAPLEYHSPTASSSERHFSPYTEPVPQHQHDPAPNTAHPGLPERFFFTPQPSAGPQYFNGFFQHPEMVPTLFPEVPQPSHTASIDVLEPELVQPHYPSPQGLPASSYMGPWSHYRPDCPDTVHPVTSPTHPPLSPTYSYETTPVVSPLIPVNEQHQEHDDGNLPVIYCLPDADLVNPPRLNQLQAMWFREIEITARCARYAGPFIRQRMYVPHTTADRLRYVTQADLERPIYFTCINPEEDGILLEDAMKCKTKRLIAQDEQVFQNRGPSISLRLEWPCYEPWSKQIPTRDFREKPQPITRAKLAKNVAKHVKRFIDQKQGQRIEMDTDARWRVGGSNGIKFEDLMLVSLHHVSKGSWQPQLRLSRPL